MENKIYAHKCRKEKERAKETAKKREIIMEYVVVGVVTIIAVVMELFWLQFWMIPKGDYGFHVKMQNSVVTVSFQVLHVIIFVLMMNGQLAWWLTGLITIGLMFFAVSVRMCLNVLQYFTIRELTEDDDEEDKKKEEDKEKKKR